jgi:hypothetical protein
MGLLDRLGELGKALLTTEAELRHLRDTLADIRQEVRERLVKLETSRESDRSQLEAEAARFKIEVERAELWLSRLLPVPNEPPSLPDSEK